MSYAPTLTPVSGAGILPNSQIVFASLPATCTAITVYRLSDNRTSPVRGGITIAARGGAAVVDFEAALDVPSTYRAEMFSDTAGTVPLGYTDSAVVTVPSNGRTYVHQPLNPSLWVSPTMLRGSGDKLGRQSLGSTVYPEGAEAGTWIGSARHGLMYVPFSFMTETLADAEAMQSIYGQYGSPQVAVVCIRTPPPMRIPRTFFGALSSMGSPAYAMFEQELDVHSGGSTVQFDLLLDEVQPPAPGIVQTLLRRKDLDAAYPTRAAMNAAYVTRLAMDSDYSLAGLAGP